MGYNITDVVKHLLIINVIVFFGASVLLSETLMRGAFNDVADLYLYFPLQGAEIYGNKFQPFQLVTHMFMHGGIGHLFFNMLTLFFFGPWLERTWGAKRFLSFYLICGFGAMLLHLLVSYFQFSSGATIPPVVGASGAVYGVLIGFAMLFPDVKVMLLIPPIPLKARYLAIGLIAYDFIAGVGGLNTGTAHFAHIGGAMMGAMMVWYWKRNRNRRA